MKSRNAFVAVFEFDVRRFFGGMIRMEPLQLMDCLAALRRIAIDQIERSAPDGYQTRGEVFKVIWFRGNCNQADRIRTIFRFFVDLIRGIDLANSRNKQQHGLSEVELHGGLTEGSVDIDSPALEGEAVVSACRCADHARNSHVLLMTSSGILLSIPSERLEAANIEASRLSSSEYIAIDKIVLSNLAK